MFRGGIALAACVAGIACGRLGFESSAVSEPDGGADARVTDLHDEDGDGVPDPVDNCPHLASATQLDGDGDDVGDVCDPNPTAATERIAVFDPFVGPRPEWTLTGPTPTFDGERMIVDARGASFSAHLASAPPGNDLYLFSARIVAVGTGVSRQLLIGAYQGPGAFYCELYDVGSARLSLTYTVDGSGFPNLANAMLQSPIGLGPVTLALRNTPPSVTCTTSLPRIGTTPVSGAPPASIVPTHPYVYAGDMQIELDYFIQIHTQ